MCGQRRFGEERRRSGISGGRQPDSFQTGEEDFGDIYFAIRDYGDTGEIPQIYMSEYELYRANGGNIRFIFKCSEIFRICGSNILYSNDGIFFSAGLPGNELTDEWSLKGEAFFIRARNASSNNLFNLQKYSLMIL